ncbi:hypothetical protein MNBD_GAMMA02-1277, partial [hydrothermal vent metagenome]
MQMNKKLYKYKRFWLLLLIVAYLLFGFLYVPKIINQQLTTQLAEQLDMQAEMTAVKFNPLTFSTEIEGLKITDANQKTWFDSQLTGINFDPSNLIWGEWKFSDLNLVQPKITLLTNETGQILIPALPEFPESAGTGEPINFSIDQIRLTQGRMNLQAGNIKKDFELNIKSIEISHDKFSLADEDTNFEIKVTTESDESIALKGRYNHLQQTINSDIQLINWQATTLNQILPDELAIKNQAGQIQATGNIEWLLSKNPLVNFTSIEVQALQSQWQNAVSFEQLQVSIQQVTVDTEAQTVAIKRIESSQGDWQVMWPLNSAVSPMADANPQGSNDVVDAETPDWQINIEQINITDWPVELIDHEVDASITFAIQSLEVLKVNNLNQAFTVQSQFSFADSGQLSITSEQVLSPLDLNADVMLKQLSLKQIAPWITDQSGLVFTQGQLSTMQKLKLNGEHFDLTGGLSIKNANIENQNAQAIANWGELQIGATTLSSLDQTIVIDQISIDQANGNIIIDSDNNINVQNLKSSEAPETAPSDNQTTDSDDWSIKIGAINIKNTSTALIDQSIKPEVKTSISELNGQIKGLSSESLSKADVNIKGKFNQFSPLSIQGKINPLSSDAYTDLKVTIEDLDLLAFSPYSAKFVAFPINGGKLNIELEYSLNQHELRGKNKLLFKQFKLGDKTPAPDAINLPLKLAVALLSDMNGEMKINLPVSGNLNDPKFSYGGLVGKAIFKLITNIVASPFKILGALIPNPDPNLSDIQFASGSAELLPPEQNKLNQIAEIMAQKAELNLQLNPQLDPTFDQAGLQISMLMDKAPFTTFDTTDNNVTEWLSAQLTPEELTTYQLDDGSIDHQKIWQALINRQVVSE